MVTLVVLVTGSLGLLFALRALAKNRDDDPTWPIWREQVNSRWYLWPLRYPTRLVDVIVPHLQRLLGRLDQHFERTTRSRLVRLAVVLLPWAAVQPWTLVPDLLPAPSLGNILVAATVLFLCVYVPVAAVLGWLTQLLSRNQVLYGFWFLAFYLALALLFAERVTIPPGIWEFAIGNNTGPDGRASRNFIALAWAFATSVAVLAPLWVFWRRPAPPAPGLRYGDAQFADQSVLRAQGTIDER